MSYNHCLINHTLNQFLSLIVIKSDNTMLFSMFKFVLSVGFVGEIQFGHGRSDLTFLVLEYNHLAATKKDLQSVLANHKLEKNS